MNLHPKRRRAVNKDGGLKGQVIDMTLVGDGVWESVYSIPIQIGPYGHRTEYQVQLDTGSSDLWLASTDCHTQSCSGIHSSNLFSGTSSTRDTEKYFNITYLLGSVSGPIVWDTVQLGSYAMSNQAFARATIVDQEPLSDEFVGVMGLALTSNSYIAGQIEPINDKSGDTPDGATIASNLFGLTPIEDAPRERYFGVLLERSSMPPSSSNPSFIPSKFSIGQHPIDDLSNILIDMSSDETSDPKTYLESILPQHTVAIEPAPNGEYLYWRTELTLLTVYNPSKVDVPLYAGSQSLYPSVILDTGGSTILASSDIANAIYGAFNINPAADGNYYVPCDTVLNMTITLSTLPPIPIHPLDLSSETPSNTPGTSSGCMGVIQASDALSGNGAPADIVLGAAFLRNTYTVLWHQTPDFNENDNDDGTSTVTSRMSTHATISATASGGHSGTASTSTSSGGIFPTGSQSQGSSTSVSSSSTSSPASTSSSTTPVSPSPSPSHQKRSPSFDRYGRRRLQRRSGVIDNTIPAISLIPLTNITLALEQFHTVRVLNQPLTTPGSASGPSSGDTVKVGSHKLSIGIVILLCIVGFGVAVALLFGGWWFTQRRNVKKRGLNRGGWMEGGGKVELRALGTSSMSGSGSGSGDGRKKSRDGEGSYDRSERSTSTNSVKFMGFAGEVDEFGDNRNRTGAKTRSGVKVRPRTGSRSMSGYFREPEPWEVAGGEVCSDDDDDEEGEHHVHLDEGESRQPAGSPSQSFDYSIANALGALSFPTHTRTPSQIGETQGHSPSVDPLLGTGRVEQSPEVTFSPLPERVSSPRRSSLSSSLAPSITAMAAPSSQQSLHRQLRGGDDRYPSLPSPGGSMSIRGNDLVDLSLPSPSHSYNDIPNPSSITSDSYFPTLPPTSELGEFEPQPRGRRSTSPSSSSPPEVHTPLSRGGRLRLPSFPSVGIKKQIS